MYAFLWYRGLTARRFVSLLKVHHIGSGLHPTPFLPSPYTLKTLVHITSLGIKTEWFQFHQLTDILQKRYLSSIPLNNNVYDQKHNLPVGQLTITSHRFSEFDGNLEIIHFKLPGKKDSEGCSNLPWSQRRWGLSQVSIGASYCSSSSVHL